MSNGSLTLYSDNTGKYYLSRSIVIALILKSDNLWSVPENFPSLCKTTSEKSSYKLPSQK